MKILFLFALCFPFCVFCQTDTTGDKSKGIHFYQGISWEEIVKVARAEKKNIFVDCYTTWCVPCKKMEKDVYSKKEVADYLNKNFISYKLQMDSTKKDNDAVKVSYGVARMIQEKFRIEGYPTILFFDMNGKILNRYTGYIEDNAFLELVATVNDPKKNFYKLLDDYQKGKRELAEMSTLARSAKLLIRDTVLSRQIAKDYIALVKGKEMFTKEHISFLAEFTETSKDQGFQYFYRYTDTVNKVMAEDLYAQTIVRPIIFRELVLPVVKKKKEEGKEPDWNLLYLKIQKNYNSYYANWIITATKPDWYRIHKKWSQYTQALVHYVEAYVLPQKATGHWPAFSLNNFAWSIFERSNNRKELEKALAWSQRAVMMDPIPNWIDTYANILYKLQESELAIRWQEIAANLDPNDNAIKDHLEKMKKMEPTWSVK